MLPKITDGEPYDPAVLHLKSDALPLLSSLPPLSLLEIQWINYYPPHSLLPSIESSLISFFESTSTSSTELRLKLSHLLFFLLPSFSHSSINTSLLTTFTILSKDDHMGIRKLCSIHIGTFLSLSSPGSYPALIEAYKRLIKDKNILVSQAAYSALGKFIYYSLEFEEILLTWAEFISLSDYSQAADLAHYLPAVYRKFNTRRKEVFEIWVNLLQNSQSAVRAKAAAMFGFFINNLPSELCNKLVGIYRNLLRDANIVKIEAISHLGYFIPKIDETLRMQFLGAYRRIQTYNLNWRVNYKIAKTLVKIAKNLPVKIWMQELWGIAMTLCGEKAEVVRMKAAKAVGCLIKDIWGINSEWDSEIKEDILKMEGKSYKGRIILAVISAICVEITWFREIFFRLCEDKVDNVRAACAVACSKFDISEFKSVLVKDINNDVRILITNSIKPSEKCDFTLIPCNFSEITLDSLEVCYTDDSDSLEPHTNPSISHLSTPINTYKGYPLFSNNII